LEKVAPKGSPDEEGGEFSEGSPDVWAAFTTLVLYYRDKPLSSGSLKGLSVAEILVELLALCKS
jgi:hypothetical protein